MYDGLSKNDLRIILAHQNFRSSDFYPKEPVNIRFQRSFRFADYFLAGYEDMAAKAERPGEGVPDA